MSLCEAAGKSQRISGGKAANCPSYPTRLCPAPIICEACRAADISRISPEASAAKVNASGKGAEFSTSSANMSAKAAFREQVSIDPYKGIFAAIRPRPVIPIHVARRDPFQTKTARITSNIGTPKPQ